MHEALLYEKLPENAVICQACKFRCRIREGKTGICSVRKNIDGKLYLLVYGKAAAAHIDPVEKKPLYHFLPGKQVFSLGTFGCNFACPYCQNWNISQLPKTPQKKHAIRPEPDEIPERITRYSNPLEPEDIAAFCTRHQVPAIAYTYNEPAIFFEYLFDCARIAHASKIRNVFVSNGYESPEALDMMGDMLDAMNIDLKAFTDRFYKKLCRAQLTPVLDTIQDVYRRGIWLEVTTLIIPGENDTKEELRDIARFLVSIDPGIPWHVSRFHPDYNMMHREATPGRTLTRAYDIGKEAGLHHVYVGNISAGNRANTYCRTCGTLLIRRNGLQSVIQPVFDQGTCLNCGTKTPGIWQ